MALKITITDAGRAEIVNAQNTGTAPVKITHVALEAAGYTPDPGQTALQNEIKRVSSIAGEVVADDTISVTAKDEGSDAYSVRGFGLITEHGTLFAVYSQADPIIEKASPSTLLLTIDVVFADIDATSLTFGDVTFSNPPASTTVAGVVRLSSAVNSTAQNLAATPNAVKQANDNANSRLAKSANLSDLGNAGTARNNLGLGTAAQQDDARYAHRSNNLADLTAPATARSNLGLGTAATANTGTGTAQVPTTSQADGRYLRQNQNLSDLGNAATARNNLGLGAAATMGTTASRTSSSTTTLLQAAAMNNHRAGGDHDERYVRHGQYGVGGNSESMTDVQYRDARGFRAMLASESATGVQGIGSANHNVLQWGAGDRRAQLIAPGSGDDGLKLFLKQFNSMGRVVGLEEILTRGAYGLGSSSPVQAANLGNLPSDSADSAGARTTFFNLTNADLDIGDNVGGWLVSRGARPVAFMFGNNQRLVSRRWTGSEWSSPVEYLTGPGAGLTANDGVVALGTPETISGNTSNRVSATGHTHSVDSTASRTSNSTATLLQAAAMNNHRTSGDHDGRYAQLQHFLGNLSGNGYQPLPNGLILQWGSLPSNSEVTRRVTFPIPFPSACFSVQITHAGDSPKIYGAAQLSRMGFDSVNRQATGNQHSMRWFAVGI